MDKNSFSILMRVALLILVYSFPINQVASQNPIPNPGFETWILENGQYEDPQYWGSQNPYTFIFIITVSKDQSSKSGTYAAKLATKGHNNTFITGVMCSGKLTVSDYSCKGGFPVNHRFAYFSGFYKYSHDSADFCMMKALMWKWNASTLKRDTVATALYLGESVSGEYAQFIAPFEFKSAEDPDSAVITIAATNNLFKAPIGSVLLVDDIAFTGSVGIDELVSSSVALFPNPADDLVVFRLPEAINNVTTKIMDLSGRVMAIETSSREQFSITTSHLPGGLYLYTAEKSDGKRIATGKLLIQH